MAETSERLQQAGADIADRVSDASAQISQGDHPEDEGAENKHADDGGADLGFHEWCG